MSERGRERHRTRKQREIETEADRGRNKREERGETHLAATSTARHADDERARMFKPAQLWRSQVAQRLGRGNPNLSHDQRRAREVCSESV